MDKNLIPGCTYCHPQVASVGLTEAKAKEQKREIRVGKFPFVGNGKAIALGEDQGLVKVIFDKKTGALLGAHMVGAEVTELIQGYVVAMNLETTEEELMHTIFPHPTISETMKEAVLDAYGRVLNMWSARRAGGRATCRRPGYRGRRSATRLSCFRCCNRTSIFLLASLQHINMNLTVGPAAARAAIWPYNSTKPDRTPSRRGRQRCGSRVAPGQLRSRPRALFA